MNRFRGCLAVAALLGVSILSASPASALTVFTVGKTNTLGPGGDPGVATGQTIVDNYNNAALATNGVPRSGTQTFGLGITEVDNAPVALYNATIPGLAADPYGYGGNFEALQPGGTAIFEFNGTGVKSFSAYLGSIDQYNYIDILGAGNAVIDQISGSQLLLNHYGNQSAAITNRRVFIDGLPTGATGIEFSTTGIAFEFDDIAVSDTAAMPTPPSGAVQFAAVPEPATWGMMLLGVGMIGAGMRLARRKNAAALATA